MGVLYAIFIEGDSTELSAKTGPNFFLFHPYISLPDFCFDFLVSMNRRLARCFNHALIQ